MKISQSSVDIHKNALYAIAVNSIQIVAAVVLAALLVIEKNNLAIDIFSVVIAVVVTAGAALDIREAMAARRKSDEADMLSDMVAQMDALNRSLRAQRHDFLNHLQVVFSLIEMEEQQEAADYIEKVYGDMQSVSRAMRTDNPAINALLRAKLADCEAAGVLTEMDVSGNWRELPMPAWEMCRVFSNLMDNAIDALEDTADKRLRILLREDLHGFSFSFTNNGPAIPQNEQRRIFEAGVSSRGEGRGMGLYIVRCTLEKYDGNIHVTSDESRTIFSGFIPHGRKEHHEQKTTRA